MFRVTAGYENHEIMKKARNWAKKAEIFTTIQNWVVSCTVLRYLPAPVPVFLLTLGRIVVYGFVSMYFLSFQTPVGIFGLDW